MVSSNGGVILVKNSDSNNTDQPRIGTVAVQNSTDITFGNKTFYQGPVTIKQFLLDEKNNNKQPGKTNNTNNAVEQIQSDQYFNIKNHQFSKKSFILMMVTILCALFGIILLLAFAIYGNRMNSVVKTGDGDDSRKNIAINSTIGTDMLTGKVLRLISRDEWLAQPPNEILTPLIVPAKRIIITHTATEFCETQAACTLRARLMQTFHMESKGWDDIGYNFMIGGDGAVYEGRGWESQGAHTKGYNVGSIGVAYIGTFNKKLPNDKMINVGFLLFQEGVKIGRLIPDYKIYGHRQLIASESPGAAFYDLIKTWNTSEGPETSLSLDSTLSLGFTSSSSESTTTAYPKYNFTIVTRSDWGAIEPRPGIKNLTFPIQRIIITHTADQMRTCNTEDECSQLIKDLQRNGMNTCRISDIDDIPFNFIIGGNGDVFEGRGWNLIGEHSPDRHGTSYNKDSIGISFIGDYRNSQPSQNQIDSIISFFTQSIQEGKLNSNYSIYYKTQLIGQTDENDQLFKTIKSFQHWNLNLKTLNRLENIDQLETISRDSWTSNQYIIGKHKQLNPIQRIIVMETGDVSCTTIESCKQFLQHKQNKDYPKADDIKENFFVGYDGTIYEGRGWSREGQHTYDSAGTSYNSQAIGLSLIGNFTKKPPNELQWNATVLFLKKAVNDTKLDVDYKVFHQKQLIGIDGNNQLYNATKKLNNWKSTPVIIHRNEWGATANNIQIKSSSVPMSEVIVRNVGKSICKTKNSCVDILNDIPKTNHTMDNFIFGGNNFTFEGRSFDDNKGSLFIGYIPENFKNPVNVTKLEEFLDYAVDLGKLDKNYTIYYK
ncbi:unnamed protein product [Diamesa tonsa]